MRVSLNDPQADFLEMPHKYRAFVCGYGGGKSYVGATSQVIHFLEHPRVPQGYFAPSYGLIRDIFFPLIEEVSFNFGMTVDVKESNKEVHFYQGRKYYGTTICRTMDKPGSIVGFKIGRAFVDEIDILPTDKAMTAWRKIIARLRYKDGNIQNGVDLTTTPEGFKFTYNQFYKAITEDKTKEKQKIYSYISASTYDNEANLPADYIQSLKASYPDQLIDAYIDGRFVNLTSGTVYHCYDTVENNTEKVHQKGQPIQIGMDFNVRNMSAIVFVQESGKLHAVDELTGVLDTPTMIDLIKDRYPDTSIIIRPDASAGNKSSKSASESDISMLEDARFSVHAPRKNPAIKDRVNSANNCFDKNKVFVNKDKCQQLDLSLQQQIYDKNGMPEKRMDNNIDDLNDAFGYQVYGVFPVSQSATSINLRHAT
jgi:hypothetical protein